MTTVSGSRHKVRQSEVVDRPILPQNLLACHDLPNLMLCAVIPKVPYTLDMGGNPSVNRKQGSPEVSGYRQRSVQNTPVL